jgi:hypothetical protein
MKWLVVAGLVVFAVAALATLAGAMLPRDHVARRSLRLHRTAPNDLWAVVADLAGAPAWRPDVKTMERAPDRRGHPVWVEHGANGDLAFEIVEAAAPRRLVTEIVDSSMFGGTWTYEIGGEVESAVLTITEHGWVSNPIFRLVSKYVFGHHATMDGYLRNLAKRFGEAPDLFGE